jgi:SnoaL-like domain
MDLQYLLDLEEIKQLRYSFSWALETSAPDDLADLFTEDGWIEVGPWGRMNGREKIRSGYGKAYRDAEPWTAMHAVTNPRIRIHGDEATGTWYLQDRVIVPDFNFMLYGAAFYHDRYRRTPDGWRISATGYERTYEVTMSTESITRFKVKPGEALNI